MHWRELMLEQNLGLLQERNDTQKAMLNSCHAQMEAKDKIIETLQNTVTRQEADLIKAYLKGRYVLNRYKGSHTCLSDNPVYCRKNGDICGDTRKKPRRQKVSSIVYEHHGIEHVWGGKVGLYGAILIHERRRKDRRKA